jgi:polar amino acid transport system substrate-binding protein
MNITRRSFVFAPLALSLPGVAHALSEVSEAGYASLPVDPFQAGNSASSATNLPNIDVAAQSLAQSGRLRVAINLGNSVLAQRNSAGFLTGASVTLAKLLAKRLRVPLDTIAYPSAGMVFDALNHGAWDVAFLAVEPERALKVDFSPPYVSIDGTYLVRKDASYRRVADLDRPGVRIAVGRGAAYDLYLKRTLKQAKLLRAINGAEAIKMFVDDRLDAAAGVRQVLAGYAKDKPELRVLSDAFSKIDQAIGVPKGHPAGAAYIRAFVEEMTASGQVRKALEGTA